jgi:hypothetical protein
MKCYPNLLIHIYHNHQNGNHTEIVLLGHSRGGLAARSFMQGGYENKNSVLSKFGSSMHPIFHVILAEESLYSMLY